MSHILRYSLGNKDKMYYLYQKIMQYCNIPLQNLKTKFSLFSTELWNPSLSTGHSSDSVLKNVWKQLNKIVLLSLTCYSNTFHQSYCRFNDVTGHITATSTISVEIILKVLFWNKLVRKVSFAITQIMLQMLPIRTAALYLELLVLNVILRLTELR